MEIFIVKQIENLMQVEFSHLVEESKEDGFRFLKRLVQDYKEGSNTFRENGESLYGVFDNEGVLVAIGGLNIDPFSVQQRVGRVRRFYVSKKHRRTGIGRLLMKQIMADANNSFNSLVLKTDTDQAAKFYTTLGFSSTNEFQNATHHLKFSSWKA